MNENPYQAPLIKSDTPDTRPVPRGADWPALSGLFVGAIAAYIIGIALSWRDFDFVYLLAATVAVVGGTTIVAWGIGRLLRQTH